MADLDELVDVYSGRLARLIITTNLTPAQFKARYSSRILSRLRAHARWKSLSGGDRRTK
jgi:DNA replication protein DnaC